MKDDTDYRVELFYRLEQQGQVYDYFSTKRFPTATLARDFRATALRTKDQWAPKGAFDIEVGDLEGPDILYQWPTREKYMAGIAMVREALANAKGPLAKDLGRAVTRGIDGKARASGERLEASA